MFLKYFLILISYIYVCSAYPLALIPNDEIYIDENNSLELYCKDAILLYPKNLNNEIPSSPADLVRIEIENATITLLMRNQSVYGDAGWYGCVHTTDENHVVRKLHNIYMTPYNYNESDVEWTYVYVNSSNNFFVESKDKVKNLINPSSQLSVLEYLQVRDFFSVRPGETVVFPYRPILPTLNVTLFKGNEKVELNNRITYDPRRGFTINNVITDDSGDYSCSIDESYRIDFVLSVTDKTMSAKPSIYDFTTNYDVVEKTLKMECSIVIDEDIFYNLEWKTPQKSDRISTEINTNSISNDTFLLKTKNKLTIKNFTREDQGVYECQLYKDSELRSRSINVELIENGTVVFKNLDTIHVDTEDISNESDNITNSRESNYVKNEMEIFSINTEEPEEFIKDEITRYLRTIIHKEVEKYLKEPVQKKNIGKNICSEYISADMKMYMRRYMSSYMRKYIHRYMPAYMNMHIPKYIQLILRTAREDMIKSS